MGWSSGSELADNVWNIFNKLIPKGQEAQYAQKLIDLFENMDCDTMEECDFVQKFYR